MFLEVIVRVNVIVSVVVYEVGCEFEGVYV